MECTADLAAAANSAVWPRSLLMSQSRRLPVGGGSKAFFSSAMRFSIAEVSCPVTRFVDNAVAAIERSEHSKWTNDYLLPGCPYALLDVNLANLEGDTPLHIAAHLGSQHLVEFLISIGADASLQNKGQLSPLERARLAKRDKVLDLLTRAC